MKLNVSFEKTYALKWSVWAGVVLCLLAGAMIASAQSVSITVNRGNSPLVPGRPIDGYLSTNGTLLAAVNFGGSTNQNRGPGTNIVFTVVPGANPSGLNWSTVASSVDASLGGFATNDSLFFTEVYGSSPVTLTYTNLDPAHAYILQVLHGEPRGSFMGYFASNQIVSVRPDGVTLTTNAVPAFQLGNNVANEVPPNSNDLALVTAQISGASGFTYVMRSATNNTRGPSIAGFQVRDISRTVVVTTASEIGAGALRQLIANAQLGDIITFTNSLSGATLTLSGGALVVNTNVSIDASALPGGFRINANGTGGIFNIKSNVAVSLDTLTLTEARSSGGAVLNSGSLQLNDCTLFGNTNTFGSGAAIYSVGNSLVLNQCTLSGNVALVGDGGGIFSDGLARLRQCTVSGNIAAQFGGGIFNTGGADRLLIQNCIVAGNSAGTANPEIDILFTALGNNLTNGSPRLAPLADYGGPNQTMAPLPGSPAIDAGDDSAASIFATDQRGLTRKVGAHVDLGTVELQRPFQVVTSSTDNGPGSLREALTRAEVSSTIRFTNTLSGATITLASGQLLISNNVAIDASSLPAGLTLNGNQLSRLFQISPGDYAKLDNLILSNGTANIGGAVQNGGVLEINRCTLVGNNATNSGGAIHNSGSLTLNQCTLTRNTATNGGAIYGAAGKLLLIQSTVVSNTAFSQGGGYYLLANPAVTNSILAGNTAPSGNPDFAGISYSFPVGNVVNGDPGLAALGNYGGPTPTMQPIFGSPAVDCGDDSIVGAFSTDQRGRPRLLGAHLDAGAVEGFNNSPLPSVFTSSTQLTNGVVQFTFTNLTDTTYSIFASTNVAAPINTWTNIGSATETTPGSGQFNFTDVPLPGVPQRYYRVRSP
ncbi:MAG: hypothetical protein RLY20_407 [Verrucomicrobiota bacterium]|jgi:hypothetical protein